MLMLSRISSRMSSTPVCDAASNSKTSIERLSEISLHEAQASPSSEIGTDSDSVRLVLWQFRALASSLAVVVLPTPREPLKIYA